LINEPYKPRRFPFGLGTLIGAVFVSAAVLAVLRLDTPTMRALILFAAAVVAALAWSAAMQKFPDWTRIASGSILCWIIIPFITLLVLIHGCATLVGPIVQR
jgi:hypothetical protein